MLACAARAGPVPDKETDRSIESIDNANESDLLKTLFI